MWRSDMFVSWLCLLEVVVDLDENGEPVVGLDELYGSAEEFLAYLESHACGCDFCERRVAWLRECITGGIKVEPPYLDGSLFK